MANTAAPLLPVIDRQLSPLRCARNEKISQRALVISVILNVAISIVKLIATVVSGSLAVTATLVDSVLDVLSQFILFYTDAAARKHDAAKYPAGRTRMAPLGIFLCAVLMGMASMEVMRESISKLSELWLSDDVTAKGSDLVLSGVVLWSMVFGFTAKLGLYIYCTRVYRMTGNDSVKAVALDHLNDVFSILSATLAAVSSYYSSRLVWVDPVSAIAISIYIIREWWETAEDQAHMLVGKAAGKDFLESVREIVNKHHGAMRADIIRAYHFGPKLLVEVEVILPPDMSLRETHDIGMELQHKIEAIDEVERAFVHMDYVERDYDEHRPESWPQHYIAKVNNVIHRH